TSYNWQDPPSFARLEPLLQSTLIQLTIEPGTPYVLRQWDNLSKKTHAASVYRFPDIYRGKIFQQLYKRTRFEGLKGYTAIKKELPVAERSSVLLAKRLITSPVLLRASFVTACVRPFALNRTSRRGRAMARLRLLPLCSIL